MNHEQPSRNLAASIQQRLHNRARQQKESYEALVTRYGLERLLYRLSQSAYQDRFILKGAMLFNIWSDEQHRPTRDIDLLAKGTNDINQIEQIFREIVILPVEDDGLTFQAETVKGERIKEAQEYEGVRCKLIANFTGTKTRITFQIDIGFGDVVTPEAKLVTFPTLLERVPSPSIKTYPRETVIAEKFEAMVKLGIGNSRMKDFYDIWFLCKEFEFEGKILSSAIKATFKRRGTSLPLELPLALTPEFSEDLGKNSQWKAFLKKANLKTVNQTLSEVVIILKDFLMPPCLAAIENEEFQQRWFPSGAWQTHDTSKI